MTEEVYIKTHGTNNLPVRILVNSIQVRCVIIVSKRLMDVKTRPICVSEGKYSCNNISFSCLHD